MFSGRPDPSMMLDDATAKNLFKKLSFGSLKRQTEKTAPLPSVLGYRGLVIEQEGKRLIADMPQRLHYAHDMVYADGKAAKAEEGLESFLFDNFKKLRNVKDLPDFRRTTEVQLKEYLDKRKLYIDNYINFYFLLFPVGNEFCPTRRSNRPDIYDLFGLRCSGACHQCKKRSCI